MEENDILLVQYEEAEKRKEELNKVMNKSRYNYVAGGAIVDEEEMQVLIAEGERVTGSSGKIGTPNAETNTGRYDYDIDVLMERWDKILKR